MVGSCGLSHLHLKQLFDDTAPLNIVTWDFLLINILLLIDLCYKMLPRRTKPRIWWWQLSGYFFWSWPLPCWLWLNEYWALWLFLKDHVSIPWTTPLTNLSAMQRQIPSSPHNETVGYKSVEKTLWWFLRFIYWSFH